MGFTVLEKRHSTFGPRAATERKVCITKYKGASTHLNISSALAFSLGWTGGQKAKISVGTGADEGWLCVEKSTSGYSICSAASKSNTTKAVKIGFTGVMDHVTQASVTPCKFNVVNGALYVEIPERFRNPTPAPKIYTSSILRQEPEVATGYISPRAG